MKKMTIYYNLVVVGLVALIFYIVVGTFFAGNLSAEDSDEVAVNEPKKDVVIYYIPHQDDDILTFGSAIARDIDEGKDVHVVLMTDGSGTIVGEQLGLTKEELVHSRNMEFTYAMNTLGVNDSKLHKLGVTDGNLTVRAVKKVVENYEMNYPESTHKGYTYLDEHEDHKAVGNALRELKEQGKISTAKFFVRRGMEVDVETTEVSVNEELHERLVEASRYYQVEDVQEGMLGIGWKSVPQSFKNMIENPKNRFHY